MKFDMFVLALLLIKEDIIEVGGHRSPFCINTFIFQADKELKRRRTGSLDDEDDDEDEDEDEVDEGMDEGEGRLGR